MDSQHVQITKASDNTVSHSFVLAEGGDGQPLVKLGSREKEVAKAGARGAIVIESLHRGSGQHVARDPMMYEFADGMFADDPGLLRNRGEIRELSTVGNALTFPFYTRGAVFGTPARDQPYEAVVVVPTAAYNVFDNGVATSIINAATNMQFTGSYARLGKNIFLGQHESGGVPAAIVSGRLGASNANNVAFESYFLAAKGGKMWRAWYDANDATQVSWTDDLTNATPIFSTPFVMGTPPSLVSEIGVIGGHAIVGAVSPTFIGSLMAVDISGAFTPLLENLPAPISFVDYLGGLLVIPFGGSSALHLTSPTNYRIVRMNPLPRVRGQVGFLAPRTFSFGAIGFSASALNEDLFVPLYGTFTKRDGTTVRGSIITRGVFRDNELSFHPIATPESMDFLTNAHVMGMDIAVHPNTLSAATNAPGMVLRALIAQEHGSNASQSNVKLYAIELGRGSGDPAVFDAVTKFLRTSRYPGDSWVTKKLEMLRGYVTQLPANSSAIVRVYLDGATAEATNFSLNTVGPFAQSLPVGVIGRDIALDIETNANGSVVIEFPWSIDYFAVPDQKDIVRLPIVAGHALDRAGGIDERTRGEVLDTLADICASPVRWTLKWLYSTSTPDWDVLPIGYEANDTQPEQVPGEGAAVAWLVLQRL